MKRTIIDIMEDETYDPILVKEGDMNEIKNAWFYDVAKRIGFDFDNPREYRKPRDGYTILGWFFRLGNTTIYIASRHQELFIWKGRYLEYPLELGNIVCHSIVDKEVLFVKLVNELLALEGYDPVEYSKDGLPDDVNELIDIVNGKENNE
jgi:hypothetical protein